MFRAVCDTNVLLSAFVFDGLPEQIINQAGKSFELILSDELIAELTDVFDRPKIRRVFPSELVDIGTLMNRLKELGQIEPFVASIASFEPDPNDEYLLDLSFASRADYLVTGDAALLKLKGTKIVTPRAFLAVLERNA